MTAIQQKLVAIFQGEHAEHLEHIRSILALLENVADTKGRAELDEAFHHIADERWDELGRHFRTPPNVFDGFMVHDPDNKAQAELAHAQAQLAQAREELVTLRKLAAGSFTFRVRRKLLGLARRLRGAF